jgi:hypothetical protein
MFALSTETLAAVEMTDLIEFRKHLAFRTVNHSSTFATKQYRARIAEIDAEMSRRSNVLSIEA